MVELELAL